MRYDVARFTFDRRRRSAFVRLLATTCLIGGASIAIAPAASAAPVWSVQTSPSPLGQPTGALNSVACGGVNSCVTVSSGPAQSTYFQGWNGSGWSTGRNASPNNSNALALNAVACPTATSCFAVGFSSPNSGHNVLTAQRWNGTAWSVILIPTPGGSNVAAQLLGLSCPTPTNCNAVGDVQTLSNDMPFAEHWNGTSWAIVPVPAPSGATNANLTSVSCVSATACWGVGGSSGSSGVKALVEFWNGSAWAIGLAANPPGTTARFLNGVSCATGSSCFAVGRSSTAGTDKTFAERWDGNLWSIVTTPNPPAPSVPTLSGVVCSNPSNCNAVGSFTASNEVRTLAEHWNGSSWSIVVTPASAQAGDSVLTSVACVNATHCFAVGRSSGLTLIEQWSGTSWSISPPPANSSQSQLAATTCPTTTSCFAVGTSSTTVRTATLVEHWNGSAWSILSSPNPVGATDSGLTGVACPGPTSCYAVGRAFTNVAETTLIEHWNGASWSIMTSPHPSGTSALAAVSCSSLSNCVSVGTHSTGANQMSLTERWDGAHWSIVSSPNPPGSADAAFSGVSCRTTTLCFAVGTASTPTTAKTFIERWNGTVWSIANNPQPSGATISQLSGISCSTATSCSAVGQYLASAGFAALVERWNGATWSIGSSPPPPTGASAFLAAVSCSLPANCWAVGHENGAATRTLIEHWNGTAWSVVVPNPADTTASTLRGVSCVNVATCFAVGDAAHPGKSGDFTVIERFR